MSIYSDLSQKLNALLQLAKDMQYNLEQALKEVSTEGDGRIENRSNFKSYAQKIFYAIGDMDKLDTEIRHILENNRVTDSSGYSDCIYLTETSDDQ